MSLGPIKITDEELIVRAYFRKPSQTNSFETLLDKDFARSMERHSGISLWRVSKGFSTRDQVKEKVKRKNQLTGLAICTGKSLKAFGLTFIAKSETDSHLSARCPGCDLNLNQLELPLCSRENNSPCRFELFSEYAIYGEIADVFKVDTQPE